MTREPMLAFFFPRRCPFCNRVLPYNAPQAAFCAACAETEKRLRHEPPRLPKTEHDFYVLHGAAAAYYYTEEVRRTILACKEYGHPWYARELADRMLVCLWGAEPPRHPGGRPTLEPSALPRYDLIVPVPPREPDSHDPELPQMLARRLGEVMALPVREVLELTRKIQPQKTLDREHRLQNTKNAYAVRKGEDVEGLRILLVDDVITTGGTVSACAQALVRAGSAEVFAVCIAASETLPKEKQSK